MNEQGKLIIYIGLAIVLIGVIWYFFGNKLGWLGNLPGDIRVEGENSRFYFPITTMILVSVVGSLLFNLARRFF